MWLSQLRGWRAEQQVRQHLAPCWLWLLSHKPALPLLALVASLHLGKVEQDMTSFRSAAYDRIKNATPGGLCQGTILPDEGEKG